jgi:sulfatase maturation enzyme AslB (radical SAM superfamily)
MTLKKTWKVDNLKLLHIELSNQCNAACPMCPRYLYHTEIIDPSLQLTQMSLETFKKYFPKDLLSKIKRISFCGTHGDPLTTKDIIPIIEYIYSCNNDMYLTINSNGGLRTIKFWNEFGKLLKDKAHDMTFSLDGLEDTNHLYRRRVNWKRAIENAQAFIDAGGNAVWDYLIFEHNEHQIEEARQKSIKMGFSKFLQKRALGFSSHTDETYKPCPVYDKDGNLEYYLSPPSEKEKINSGKNRVEHLIATDRLDAQWHLALRKALEDKHLTEKYSLHVDKKIDCKFLNRDPNGHTELYVNANGTVVPCCFMGSSITGSFGDSHELQVRNIFYKNRKKLSLERKSLKEIVESNILTQLFVEKWDHPHYTNGKPVFCSITCGTGNSIDRIFIDR